MLKGIFGTNDNGSEVSSSSKRKSKRRDGDEEEESQISRRSRTGSTGTPSSSKRKSSRRESTEQPSGFHPTSTAFSSTSRSPYADVAAPSVASSYATAYTEPSNAPIERPEVVRNESLADKVPRSDRPSGSRRDGKRDSWGDTSRTINDDDERRNAGRSDTSRRDSRKKPSRKDTATRGIEDHDNALPQNQFPGQEPAGFGVASPYRPPGLASDYYGDHGESIADQPGVRPDQPSILISADQAHLLEPTVEPNPPAEPSSLGQVGAAAEFFGEGIVTEPMTTTTSSRPGRKNDDRPGRRPSLKPGRDSTADGASPRSSPGPDPRKRPLPQSQNSSIIGTMGAGAAPLAAGAMAAGVGAATEYYTGNITVTPHDQPLPSGIPGRPDEIVPGSGQQYTSSVSGIQSQSYYTTNENMQTTSSTITSSSRPPRPSQSSSSNMPLYGAAAAAAGIAGAAYLAHEHTSAQHEQAFNQPPTAFQGRPSDMPFRPGENQSQTPFGPQQQQMRRRRTGAFGKFVDWFQDPAAVAEYEAYTEAIGVCKYCFEPGTSPAEAPRRHNYRRRRPSSGSRYGSSIRVDKLTRYSSDENLKRRNSKKGYSTTEKVLATSLAGVGAAAVANEVYKNKNDFNDTYSVKSGQPDNRSRVAFQENEEERYSASKRKSRRESEDMSRQDSGRRRQSGSEGEVRYEKRSSRRRDSSGSDNRTASRGSNLSTPVALAGAAAVGVALTSSGSRRRSRSRSKSPRRNRKGYYSKRVSPKHSYVDLNQTLEDSPSGPMGLAGFFSSPSSNSKRGKKKKGLFNFSNNSSSSSDADLVFGEGTVKRKEKRGRRDNRGENRRQSGTGDTAAILGLAATGAELVAETNRRDSKGKRQEDRRTDSSRYDDDRNRKLRRDDRRNSTNKIKLEGHQNSADNGEEGVWEDASDDDQSSVDMGLAYGGRLSSRESKESLNDGINILGWRFGGNQRKREEEKRVRRQSSKSDLPGYDPTKVGVVAGAAGLVGAAAADYYSRPGPTAVENPPKDMPLLRYIDPMPVDSREQTPRRQFVQTSVSPMAFPIPVTRTSDTSLEHPQPITPISKDVYQTRQSYSDGPNGPVVFDKSRRDSRGQETGIIAAAGTAAATGAPAVAINDSERERKRDNRHSATMPTVGPSLKDGVSFNLTKEQDDREQRRERKRREKEARKATEAASAVRDAAPKASIITGAERSPERKLETWRLRDAIKVGGPGSMEPPVRDPSPQSSSKDLFDVRAQPLPTPERETRLSEIDRQLEELYAQHREQEARKRREIEGAGVTAAAVAVGVGAVAATSDFAEKGENKPRRKSSLRKSSKYRDQNVETESGVSSRSAASASASDTATETTSERLARKAARRVQNQRTPSPVHQHDDYTAFFVPPELKERMAEHNRDAESAEAKIVDIVPGMRRAETFPDDLYHAYGTEDSDIPPTKLPWKVPMLGLVSPTPPPRSPSISAEKSPVILATSGSKDIGEPEIEDIDPRDIEPRRSNSKVTWGDHEINVYEVITPEYERDGHDFTTSSPEVSAKKDALSSPLRQAFTVDDDENTTDKDMDQQVPPVDKMTKEQREHLALGKDFADLPSSQDVTRDMPKTTPLIEERKPSSAQSTPAMQFEQFNPAGSTTSAGSFYQSPFVSTVSDLDLPVSSSLSRVPADSTGFDAGKISDTSKEEKSDERLSKSERRRRERAEASAEAGKAISETSNTETRDMTEPHVPGGFDDAASDVNVFDYMVTLNGSTLPTASALGAAATSVLGSDVGKGKETSTVPTARDLPISEEQDSANPSRAETFDESAFVDSFATPKRSDTFDESALIDSFATPERAETFAEGSFSTPRSRTVTSDPEDWEKTSSSLKKSKKSRDSDDFYELKKPSSKKSKHDSQVFAASDPDDDVKSIASSPADASRSRSKRKSSKRDDDDDARSVVSDTKSAASEPTSSSKRKNKEKDSSSPTAKKSGWALLGGLIGAAAASKSDVSSKSEPSEKRKSKSSDPEKKRRSSKSADRERGESVGSESRRSRSVSQSSTPLPLGGREREESVDDAFVSADENGTNGHADARDMEEGAEESFLATRPELPKPMGSEHETGSGNGASGLPSESQALLPQSTTRNLDAATSPQIAVETSATVSESADFSTPTQPHQRRLSNLRTTDLGSVPVLGSPVRLGRFPISPGVIRAGSLGSPPTASASSPSTTPRTRQGRPMSSDFRSGKEFRPLYLVERHSATKVPVQEEDETYPSLPSSRTSSAHPSLENLRGEYSDGDVEINPQPRSHEPARRYSWGDARARSPEFLDSGAATPTQDTFPGSVSVGERKEKERGKPRYEFHSPSELLEDPSHHRGADVPETTDAVGSPLPSAVGTERSSSPVSDAVGQKSRSRSSSTKEIGLGIGAGLMGAAAGAFAADSLVKDGDEPSRSANAPVAREIEVQEPTDEDFALQPISTKKSKKDKKKKQRKTSDLADDDVKAQDPRDVQDLPEVGSAERAVGEPSMQSETTEAVGEDQSRDASLSEVPALITTVAEEPVPTVTTEEAVQEPEDEWAVPSKKSKLSKKDKKGKHKDSLPFLSTIEAEPARTDQELEDHSQTETDPVSAEPTTSIEDNTTRDLEIPTIIDTTDSTANIDEKSPHASSFENASGAPPPGDAAGLVERKTSLLPLHKTDSTAFEAAFEAARAARGLPDGVSKEVAMDGLVASSAESAIKTIDIADLEDKDHERNPFGDDYEIENSRDVPKSFAEDRGSFGDNFEVAPAELVPSASARSKMVEVLPVIAEAASSKERSLDDDVEVSGVADELSPVTQPEQSKNIEQMEAPAEQVDDLAGTPTEKSKKDKKSKKKSRTLDDLEASTLETGTGTLTPADAEPAAEESRDLVLPPVTAEIESSPVAEAKQTMQAVQEESSAMGSENAIQPERPVEATATANDELASASSKKSKKDKKSKKKSRVMDDLESESQDTGSQTPLVEDESRDSQVDILHEQVVKDIIEPAGGPTIMEEPVVEPAEDDWAVPSKKSKKDKKSKRKSTASDEIEPESQILATAAPEAILSDDAVRELQEPVRINTEPEELVTVEAPGATEEPSPIEEPKAFDESKAIEKSVEEEWAAPVKKSKKDKQSKRSKKSTGSDPIEPESDALETAFPTASPSDDPSREVREPAQITAEPEELEAAEEPITINEPDEDAWAVPVKKSKKDKKSKKRSAVFNDIDPESEALEAAGPEAAVGNDIPPEVRETAQVTAEPEELPVVEEPTVVNEPVEDARAVPVKKSKKDKKSKKKSAVFDDVESESPATGTQTPINDDAREVHKSTPLTEEQEQLPLTEEPTTVEVPAIDDAHQLREPMPLTEEPEQLPIMEEPTTIEVPAIDDARELQKPIPLTEEPEQLSLTEQPKTAEEPVEDAWAVPTKKSKKDRKSKRKTLDFDSPEPTETSTPTSEPLEVEHDESSDPVAASTAGLAAGAIAGLAGAAIVNEDKDKSVEVDERVHTSSKKSKKDKKSKKGKSFSLVDDEESTPAPDTTESEREMSNAVAAEEQACSTQEPASVDEVERSAAFAQKLSAEPDEEPVQIMGVDREAPGEGDEWAVPTKKSKDKKSKKKGNVALLAENQPAEETYRREPEPESQVPDQSSRDITKEDFPVAPTAAHIDDVTSHYFGMLKDYRPASGAPDNKAAQTTREAAQNVIATVDKVPGAGAAEVEHLTAVSQSSVVEELDAPALSSSNPAHDFPVISEISHVDDVTGFHYGMLKEYKPDTASIQRPRDIAEQVLPSASEVAATSVPVDPQEDSWAVPAKKSKKDKKKQRQSVYEEDQPDANPALPEASQKDLTGDTLMIDAPKELAEPTVPLVDQLMETDAPNQADVVEPANTNEEDLYPVLSKKSKKEKKKKRQPTFDDFEEPSTEQSKDISESDAALPVATGVGAALLGAGVLVSSQNVSADDVAAPETPAVEEDFTSSSSKKSKKDKKKQQSTFDGYDDEQTTLPSLEESSDAITKDVVPSAGIVDTVLPPERPEEVVKSSADAEEQPLDFSTKKSKKDKKKKRASTFDDFDTAPATSADDLSVSAPVIETGTMPESQRDVGETVEPAEDETLIIAAKTSKKDKKKKRESTFDDFDTAPATSADDLGVSAPVVEMDAMPESQRDVGESIAPAEDETFVMPGKQSKKDKKKKRQVNIDDVEREESAGLPTEAQISNDPIVETDAAPETMESEILASKTQDPPLGDDGWPIEQHPTEAAPIEQDEWAVPIKKSKKDRKTKKNLLSLADGEDSASQPTEPSTPAEAVEVRDIQMQDPILANNEVVVKSDAQSPIISKPTPIVIAHPDDEEGHAMDHQKHLSKRIPGGWDEEEEEDPMLDEPTVDVPMVDEPSKVVDNPVQDVVEPRDRDVSRGQQEVESRPEEEETGYVAKKNKKDKKGKKSKKSEAYSEEPESRDVAEAQTETAPETFEQTQVENVSDEVMKEAAPGEESSFTAKKSKKDKKGKKGKNIVEEDVATPEILAIPETTQESSSRDTGADDEWAVPTKKSKKDKKSKRQSTRDAVDDAQPEEPVPFPANDPDHVDDVARHYHGMLQEYRPASGGPDNKPRAISHEIVNEPGVPHIDDVTGHYFGMLREYQPTKGAPDNKPALARESEEAQRVERGPSPVSDEETRRARRVRRKASPVYSGEEPEDLPGNRSLTPPTDHNDMMTTALGVAAGLGLTGAAANAASARSDAGEARSLDAGQVAASTAQASGWSFEKINTLGGVHQAQRDSGVQFADSPTLPNDQFDSRNRDSGYVNSPASRESWPEAAARDIGMLDTSNRPPRPQSPTSSSEDVSGKRSTRVSRDMDEAFTRREPSPVQSTSKDRSSKLFNSSPSNRVEGYGESPRLDTTHHSRPTADIHRSPSIHGHHRSREELRALSPARQEPRHMAETHHEQLIAAEPHRSIFGPYPTQEGHGRGISPPKTPLRTISEHSQNTSPSLRRQRDVSDIGEDRPHKAIQHQESGRNLRDAAGIAGVAGIGALAARELSRDDQPASRAKSLGKSKANTKSSRSLRRTTFDPDVVPSSSTHDPSEGKGKEVVRDMSDVYDGHGEYPGAPMSPTRPPSMRKRQSMQQIKDLETRLDQLAAENRTLAEAKLVAERHLEDIQLEQHKSGYAGQEAVETANIQLREKDEAIARLQQELEGIKQDHARLSEVNAGLSDAHENLRTEHEQRYSQLEDQHAQTQQSWQESSRDLETLRGQHAELSGGMEDIVRHEIDTALAEKNAEIERLRGDLELAKEKINELRQQILAGGGDDILNFKDEDYFETACQSLCQHVQQWVLRFSKFSDTLVCRTTHQIRDEKLVDRFDLAILDGSDVDVYLIDRIKRRDVFMSVVMTMIFEYIFTRYLFGMDRDQRQTLKKLEKNLAEVGPPGAIHQWRAMTLTLLAKREAFRSSRENDTEAVVLQIYDTLAKFLPPPQNLQAQVQESLRNVMRTAVDLSIEMRTQKAEYIMLPPLQPEYDTNGDLTRKVYFNASLMNERSGETTSNDELEAQQAVVRMVLFPLVVKKGNDDGEGEEEIVVCPAQVLVARPDRKSKANSGRVVSAQSDRMSVDQMSRGNVSRHSLAPSPMDMSNVI